MPSPPSSLGQHRSFQANFYLRDYLVDEVAARYRSIIPHGLSRVLLGDQCQYGGVYTGGKESIQEKRFYRRDEVFTDNRPSRYEKLLVRFRVGYFWVGSERNLTQAFVFKASSTNPNLIVVSFRGTDPFDADDWCTDLDVSWYLLIPPFLKIKFSEFGLVFTVYISLIHQYAYYTIRQKLRDMLARDKLRDMLARDKNLKFILTEGVYTFGQPRVGDEEFGEYMKEVMKKHGIEYERFVYNNDMVTRVPFDDKILFGYKHYGSCNYFNSLYKGKVREDAPNANYISMLWLIPKLFIIRFWKGNEYKENWTMRTVRIVGIIIPGVSDHFPLDYVNSTRLGGLARPVATTTPQDKLYLIA
ncbi:hypothetical protein Bca52824_080375 [Brassica carinata]|uniref:Fungal lipase-type domain-containing protein n=1 Tax=Brassica carinata TaxID=52824 RepID=A0A8X7PII8_BRACI|nr:hypothetical protein Bca52824_080375 [Brassica carinata]